MSDFFQKMNEDYIQKHFPNGSIFEGASQTIKRRGIIVVVFILAPLFLGSLYGLIKAAARMIEMMAEGQEDMGIGIGVFAFFALITLGFLALIIIAIKGTNKKHSYYLANSAKRSKLPESDIQRFEQQAGSSDCYILKLTAGLDRVLSNGISKDGLLTRDYIYLADPAQIVMRIEDLVICCFEYYTYYANSKKINNLAIRLISSNGVTVSSDTTEKAGLALMELLTQRNSSIDTLEEKVLKEGEYEKYYKRVLTK